jgi:Xaa-Pro aminopeptidase
VLTVEPGLYFQPEDELVPAELRGIGIRIEDDILVTATGARNLSARPARARRRRGVVAGRATRGRPPPPGNAVAAPRRRVA